ncbi:MAG: ester cyclase [Thermomicrobiales bacterium]
MNGLTSKIGSRSQRRHGGMSRRVALRGLGTAALILAANSRGGGVLAQDASPAAVPSLFTDWAAAWSVDPAAGAGLYAADAVLEDVATGVAYSGPEGIVAHIAEIRAGLPDAMMTVSNGFVGDDHAMLEYVFDGTYTGQLPGLPAGTGQPVTIRGAALFELMDDLIVREAHYYDAYAFLVQLGVLPAPGAAATPTA